MKNILCFGDSNTYGFNPDWTSPEDMRFQKKERWTGILQNILGEEYDVIEEGLGGRTTAWDDPPTEGRNGLKQIVPLLQTHQPLDAIVIMLGTNDAKRIYSASVMEISRGMEELVKICMNPYNYDVMRAPQILVLSPMLLGERLKESWLGDIFDGDSPDRVKGLAKAYRAIAEKYKCGFLDAAAIVKASDTDSVHIKAAEHKKLAIAVAEKINGMM